MAEKEAVPGRGGEQHKYLQDLIKRWAEGRGYKVTTEKEVLDGLGIIDLVLEKSGCAPIACEISVSTSAEHELQNAAKCLAAGYDHVFLVVPDKDTLGHVRTRAKSVLTPCQMKKVRFVLPEEVFASISLLESRWQGEFLSDVEAAGILWPNCGRCGISLLSIAKGCVLL